MKIAKEDRKPLARHIKAEVIPACTNRFELAYWERAAKRLARKLPVISRANERNAAEFRRKVGAGGTA